MNTNNLLIIGVTASGKGRLAFELAKSSDAEIISIDSMKVYRRMDIGTAKPPRQARERIKYHLIDVVEPSEAFSVGRFLDLAYDAIEQIKGHKKRIIAVGGTALYIKALLYGLFEGPGSDNQIRAELQAEAEAEGLEQLHRRLTKIDPVAAERISPKDRKRIIRALEVYKLTGKPISSLQQQFDAEKPLHNW
jgi:tRNA dimethylallyltransferase